ncbi:exodeoxyribonuclease V subunit gamma [Nitrospira defluvii]|nr:exodeoxyribonuclease V subunit gamma [Nitrospira defluvii]
MNIFLGPFHPRLEAAFVSEIKRFKSLDPLLPLLVLVPSDLIRRRLEVLLTVENRLSLIHFSILTFHQLSQKICEEASPVLKLETKSDLFFEETLRLMIRQSAEPESYLSKLEETEGGTAALWQTVRDLKDGRVDSDVAIEALQEGQFGPGDSKKLLPLFELYRRLKTCCQNQGLSDYGDLAVAATQQVEGTPFLKGFANIFYYGFYELTQVQIDLFHAVIRHHETTLFFPLVRKNAGWEFSNRFYERYVEGQLGEASQVVDLTVDPSDSLHLFDEGEAKKSMKTPSATFINCYDIQDEVLTSAKEILRLVSDEGIPFHKIAVIARDIGPYFSTIKSLFQSHAIPITTNCEVPLLQHPFAKAVLLFLSLPLKDYPRAQFIDMASSPYFQNKLFSEEGTDTDKDPWDLLSRQAGVSKGFDSWQGISKIAEREQSSFSKQAVTLLKIFNDVHEDLSGLPAEAAWSEYVRQYQNFFDKYFGLSLLEKNASDLSEEERVKKAIVDLMQSLSDLDKVSAKTRLQCFIETFDRWMIRGTLQMGNTKSEGVTVLSAMSARGLSFHTLFLLGLNEGSFPRSIREDPFLSDRHRRVLETVLGYKLGEKLASYDEERLLLSLLIDATQDKLFALYHRVDTEGGTASRSWYLNCLRRTLVLHAQIPDERMIPRSLQTRQSVPPYNRFDLLLPIEAALQHLLSGYDPSPILNLLPFPSTSFQQGREALRQIESGGRLTVFDGLTGALPDFQKSTKKNGMTPTGLERYALCPFQFFAIDLLKLRPIKQIEGTRALVMSDMGKLCHAILKDFYSDLHQDSYFSNEKKETHPLQHLKEVSHRCFKLYESEQGLPYPLLWEEIKGQLIGMLYQVILIDLEYLQTSGYQPVAFEVNCKAVVEAQWPEMSGRLDRIDFHPEKKQVRVVDYKFTFRKQAKPNEKNLATSALRGIGLQAALYQKLAEGFGDEGNALRSVFYFLAPNWPDGPLVMRDFPEDGWDGEGGKHLKETISSLLSGMDAGHFFIKPGEYCAYCDVAALCRKEHLPSRRRLEQDPLWKTHDLLREKKWPSKTKTP